MLWRLCFDRNRLSLDLSFGYFVGGCIKILYQGFPQNLPCLSGEGGVEGLLGIKNWFTSRKMLMLWADPLLEAWKEFIDCWGMWCMVFLSSWTQQQATTLVYCFFVVSICRHRRPAHWWPINSAMILLSLWWVHAQSFSPLLPSFLLWPVGIVQYYYAHLVLYVWNTQCVQWVFFIGIFCKVRCSCVSNFPGYDGGEFWISHTYSG